MRFPVTLQFVVQVADESIWLYERKVELGVPPFTGLRLTGYCPNITGPVAAYDNVVMLIVDTPTETLVKIQGVREPSLTVEEVDRKLPDWTRNPNVLKKSAAEEKAEQADPIDRLFNPGG
jgi:hypothetical protein